MKSFKKVLAMVLVLVTVVSLTACGSSKNEDKNQATNAPSDGKVELRLSWWGGDSRHAATQAAVQKFMDTYPNITVKMEYGAWDGWEKSMSTAFYANTAPDVNQINWNWLTSYSSDGKVFADLNEYKDIIDLSQFDEAALAQCTVADKLQAIPVSMTGRIFYWNEATFEKAGIAVPTSLEELYAAGETFKTVLGEEYYPLALGEYDRVVLMVYYLESKYGKNWVENGELNYTKEEIVEGLEFIKTLEDKHVTPSIQTILGDGAQSLDKNPKWMDGFYAGIFEWDSAPTKYADALTKDAGHKFVVGDYFKDMGEYQGGFSKVSLGFAISESSKNKKEAAMLVNFLLNEEAGVELMASERGIPLSKKALEICTTKGLLNPIVAEANSKVLSWTKFQLDPTFEDATLKAADGAYYVAMQDLSYDNDVQGAADELIKGINKVLEDSKK